jgi:hypothetical protein
MDASLPMTILGRSELRNQSRTWSSCEGRRLTQPVVGSAIPPWRKIADPRPGTTGTVLYSMNAKLW